MIYTQSRLGPESTPDVIKYIIITTITISIGSAFTNEIFRWLFSIPGPQEFLSLSWWGLSQLFLWQPLSFLFVQVSGMAGITIHFLINLAFQMYLLWVMGTNIFEHLGKKHFLKIYFGSGVLAGLVTVLLSGLIGFYPVLEGPSPAIIGLAIVWLLLNPESEILLFFLIPVKAKWLIAGILGAILLINLSQMNLVNLLFYLTGACFAYIYGVVTCHLRSPFPETHAFEDRIRGWGGSGKGKIIDFRTGQEVSQSDEQFVDEMLEKIAKKGEGSLTWRERSRMQKISEKKAKKNEK